MDVALIGAALSLAPYLPRFIVLRDGHRDKRNDDLSISRVMKLHWSVMLSTMVSFLLLALSVVEAIPQSWMLLFDSSSLPIAYQVLFASICVLVTIIFPFSAGALQQQAVARMFSRLSSSNGRQPFFNAKLLFKRRQDKGPTLPMSSSDESPKEGGATNPSAARGKSLNSCSGYLAGGSLGVFAVSSLLSLIAPWVIRIPNETPLLTVAVAWLAAVGLLLSACINGFGCVSMPHSCLAGLYLKPISSDAVVKAKEEIAKAERSLQDRKDQLNGEIGVSLSSAVMTNPKTMATKSFSNIGEEVSLRRKTMQTEVEFLETLVAEMKEDFVEMKEAQEVAAQARTPVGHMKSWLGVVFSIVLLVRLSSAIDFVWRYDHETNGDRTKAADSSGRKSDPITVAILWLIGHDYARQQDYNALSQFISVLLTAILSFSQIRTFWRIVGQVNRRFQTLCCGRGTSVSSLARAATRSEDPTSGVSPSHQSSATTSASLYSYMLGILMACYFLSCLLLTKLMLPPEYREAFGAALGISSGVLQIRSYAVNLVFALSALVSAFVLGIILSIQRDNTQRHLSVWSTRSDSGMVDP